MSDASELADLVRVWREAVEEFVTLAREVSPDQADLPTDLEGWSVKDNVAHTAHLESVLAGGPEETIPVAEAPHIKDLSGFYTEQGVLARRDRDLASLADEIEQAVATRVAELEANPPTDGDAPAPRTPGGVAWSTRTLLSNRPLDVWMHSQDIRRAIGRPGGYDGAPARHAITKFGGALAMVLGKRVAPPPGTSVTIEVPDAGRSWTAQIGEDGRAAFVDGLEDPTVTVTVSAEDFVVLAGGRRPVEATAPSYAGDAELGRAVLASFAVTP